MCFFVNCAIVVNSCDKGLTLETSALSSICKRCLGINANTVGDTCFIYCMFSSSRLEQVLQNKYRYWEMSNIYLQFRKPLSQYLKYYECKISCAKHVFLCNILNISYRDLSTHISTFLDVEESWEISTGPSTAAKPSIAPRSRLRNFFLAMIIPFPYSKAMKLPRCMHSRKCIKGDRKSVRINVFVDGSSAELKKELPLLHE